MAAGLVQLPGTHREPASRLEVIHPAAQQPIDQRPQHIAQGGDAQQPPQTLLAAEQQAHQYGFRLQRQQGRGTKGRDEQPEVTDQHRSVRRILGDHNMLAVTRQANDLIGLGLTVHFHPRLPHGHARCGDAQQVVALAQRQHLFGGDMTLD